MTTENAAKQPDIIPVLIGADLNCYHLARAFYEAYGVVSHAFGRYPIGVTMHSRFIRFKTVADLDTDASFLQTLDAFAAAHSGADERLILMGCTDDYVNLIARHKEQLRDRYVIPYNDIALMDQFASKARFYECCETHGIPYPKTIVLKPDTPIDEARFLPERLGFSYPIIVKPANSIVYWKHPFDSMNKVYTADTPQQAMQIVQTIFASGYDDSVLLQDMIPGADCGMYVLTAYCNRQAKVEMMCLGHVLLEEHTPKGRGNHAAIITAYEPELMERFKNFLEAIGYVGFANFDIKFDPRDGSFRAFEVNLRQGRSNYYVTAAGENIAACVVEDYVFGRIREQTHMVQKEVLWTFIPRRIIFRYTADPALVAHAKKLIRKKRFCNSLFCRPDLRGNPKRFFYVCAHEYRHFKKYKTYCKRQ